MKEHKIKPMIDWSQWWCPIVNNWILDLGEVGHATLDYRDGKKWIKATHIWDGGKLITEVSDSG